MSVLVTSLIVSTEWILNSFTHFIAQCNNGQSQKEQNQNKQDKSIESGHEVIVH